MIAVCVVLVGIVVVNSAKFDWVERISLLIAAVAVAAFAARTIERGREAAAPETPAFVTHQPGVGRPDQRSTERTPNGPTPTRGPETAPRSAKPGSLPASDTEPPRLAGFVIVAQELDAREGPVTLEFLAYLIDDMAGIAGSGYSSSPTQARFRSPSGRQFVDAIFSDSQRTEGTPQNGRYKSTATLPRYAEGGVWHLEHFLLVDQIGNSVNLKEVEVAVLGFSTTFRLAE